MNIWVDADACPGAIKEILCRAAQRSEIPLIFVANQYIKHPPSPFISAIQVPQGFDVADDEIVRRVQAEDVLITNDIPLAAEAIEKGAFVLTVRGYRYTADNIKAKLNMRDFLETMRASGEKTGGPPALSQTDRQTFANALDRIITKAIKQQRP